MLTALIARSPVFGGKVKSFDAEKTKAVPGVVDVFEIPSGVAVIADDFWAAKKGRDALEMTWDEGEGGKLSHRCPARRVCEAGAKTGDRGQRGRRRGEGTLEGGKALSAEYDVPYLAHAPMEPLNCVVDLRDESCEIWTGRSLRRPIETRRRRSRASSPIR